MKLEQHEIHSSTWVKLKEYLTERIDAQRKKNDSTDLTDLETAALRGGLRELKLLLALDQPGLTPVTGDD